MMLVTLFLLLRGVLAAESSEHVLFNDTDERRRVEVANCSPNDDIFFNMDISILDFGGKCSSRDAKLIGEALQRVATEIGNEINSVNADLDITVCPVPTEESGRRALQTHPDGENGQRNLEKKSFTYKCGGQYNRCGIRNSNRQRFLVDALGSSAVCEIASKAEYAEQIALKAYNDAETVFKILKKDALECHNLRAGEKEVLLTRNALGECRKELETAQQATDKATQACDQSAEPNISVDDRIGLIATARTSSALAMGAAEKARGWLFVIEAGFGEQVCGTVSNPAEGITPQAVYDLRNTAVFAAEMADMAYSLTKDAFLELRQRAMECRDIVMAQKVIDSARIMLDDTKDAKDLANKEAAVANAQLERITNGATSMSDLRACVQKAKLASNAAIGEVGKAHRHQLQMQSTLEDRKICAPIAGKGRSGSLDACEMAQKATFGSDMATATWRTAEDAFSELLKNALDCSEFGMAENVIIEAKRALVQCKKARKQAVSRGRRARALCEKTKNTSQSDQQIRKSLKVAAKASRFAVKHAKKTEGFLERIQGELDRNVCRREAAARRSNASAAAVCQASSTATLFAASMATGAVDVANDIFSSLTERVLDCYDLQQGQDFLDAARAVLDEVTRAQNDTAGTAQEAKKLCQKARSASSNAGVNGKLQSVEVLSREAMRSAETAVKQYVRLRDDFKGRFCSEIEVIGSRTESGESGEPVDTSPNIATGTQTVTANEWMEQVWNMLYSKIPKFLLEEYNAAKLGSSCIIEGFNVDIKMQVLARIDERAFWITEKSCSAT